MKNKWLSLFFLLWISPLQAEQIFTLEGTYMDEIQGLLKRNGQLLAELRKRGKIPYTRLLKITYRYPQRNTLLFGDTPIVVLTTGDVLHAQIQGGNSLELQLQPRWGQRLSINLDFLKAIFFFQHQSTEWRRHFFHQTLKQIPKEDKLFLTDGGKISCMIEAIQSSFIQYQIQGLGSRKIPFSKLLALRLAPLGGEINRPKSGIVSLYTKYGDKIYGKIQKLNSREVILKTLFGTLLKLPTDAIEEIYFHQRKAPFLSQLAWETYEFIPGIAAQGGLSFPPQIGKNVLGGPLKIRGRVYREGIGVHTKTKLIYSLNQQYKRLILTFGFDDSARHSQYAPKAKLKIWGDGRLLYESKIFRPLELLRTRVDVLGVKTLILEVDFGKNREDILGRVNLVDGVLERE